jgi:hypothetical protein
MYAISLPTFAYILFIAIADNTRANPGQCESSLINEFAPGENCEFGDRNGVRKFDRHMGFNVPETVLMKLEIKDNFHLAEIVPGSPLIRYKYQETCPEQLRKFRRDTPNQQTARLPLDI